MSMYTEHNKLCTTTWPLSTHASWIARKRIIQHGKRTLIHSYGAERIQVNNFRCRIARNNDETQPLVGKNSGQSANHETERTIKYDNVHSILDDPQLAECFLALPDEDGYLNLHDTSAANSMKMATSTCIILAQQIARLIDVQTISESQQDDAELLSRVEKACRPIL